MDFQVRTAVHGKAQQAYAALTTDDALSYNAVKVAILRCYDIMETYRQRFRAAVRSNEESHWDLSIHLGDLANKWLRGVNTVELAKEAIIQEQLVNTRTPAVRVWVKE